MQPTRSGSVATDAAERIPEVASATRSALVEVDRQVEAGSDEMLTVGTALSFGLAAGLLLAGANRVMVLSAFVPGGRPRPAAARSLEPVAHRPARHRARSAGDGCKAPDSELADRDRLAGTSPPLR